ncbi:unnamed protein product [Mytilus coruscus]|uniref:COR domain-containing protein n=1 Tax=Mytilus coruscus TaxID=42192 RepID=A0A6J8A273_MYTCO|nr:unnamed protein product [Mytilus coruscus]
MLAGEQGTGKTTIARYLIGKGPTRMRKSTDGIGLYTGLSYIDRETDEWLDGKQDFSLAELTISRSLKQKPLRLPTRSISTEMSTNSSQKHSESLFSDANDRFNEHRVEYKDKYIMPGIPVGKEKNNTKSIEQEDFNKPTHSISDEKPSTNVLDLNKQQDNPQDNKRVPKVLLDTDKQHSQPPDKRPISNVKFDSDKPPRKFQSEPFYSSEDYLDVEFDDVIPVHQTNAAIENEAQEYKLNLGSSLALSNIKHSSFSKDLSLHASRVQEEIETLTKSSEVEQAISGETQSVESVTNPVLITKIKRFFGVSKDVQEIKVSITEQHLLKQSLRVGKKKLHHRHIAPVIIWDFGGQDIFYSTHQSFLSYRAIYLIVLDGSRTLDESCHFNQYLPGKSGLKTGRDYLRFWINTIVTYCKGSQHGFPKIMIVFTHKDKVPHGEVETTREQLFGDVKSMFHGSPLMSHLVIEDRIFVNARNKNDPEMARIKTSIIRESTLQPTWGQNLPKCFIPLELEFENLIRKDISVITFDDLRKINTQHPIRPLTDAELKVFLKFQHAVGKILYFDEPGLDQHVTLLPTYLIDAFKSIITDKSFCKGEKQREELWDLMSQKGVISKYAIAELWRNRKYRRFKQHKDYLIAVMTHLDILVEPKRYDLKHDRIPTDFYFVASMVQTKDDTGYLQSPFFIDRNIAISFNSNSAIIPPALSFRFITYCLSIFDVKKYDKKNNMLFHRSAVFTIDPSLDMHILCEDERIVVRLVHARKKVLILKDLASSICECLKSALQNISHLYIKTSSDNSEVSVGTFEMNLCCSVAKDPCLLSVRELNKIDSIWICPRHKLNHEKFLLSSWITEKETMMKCENNCPVTNEDFLSEDLSALHLRRLSILYNVDEIRQLVGYLNLPYTEWDDLFILETEPQLLKFKALCLCHEQSTLTFRKIKKAVEEGQIQNPHTLCKVMRSSSVDFDNDPEKWDMVPSDENIDIMAPLIGNKSLFFLVELGMDLKIWDKINYSQMKRDLVKLNKDILDEWRLYFCIANNVRPTMRMIAQAYKSIGKDVRVIETTLFN